LFHETNSLLDHLFKALQPHGARLADIRIETGGGSAADFHVLCYLFNYWVTLRVRIDRIEIVGSQLPQNYVDKYGVAVVDALRAISNYHQQLSYRAYALMVGLHGLLEGTSVKQYLSKFVKNIPDRLGPSAGSGIVMYFGPVGERLLCSVTLDTSTIVSDGLFCRTHVIWDAKKVEIGRLPELANGFVSEAINQVGLKLPS
ncbi:MAG: hypothetical protein ACREQW_08355, partial [Candidatus Binatia bacterium]